MLEIKKIGQVFKVTSGGTPSRKKKEYFIGGNIPWVKTGDLKGKYVNAPEEYITPLAIQNSSAKLFPKNTVLLAMYGATIGACSILPMEATTNQACGAILPSEDCDPVYLYYYLLSIKEELISKGVGGAQPNISGGIIKETKIPLPPLETQRKIAAILDTADAYRQKTKALLAKYDELAQSIFLDMFGDPVRNSKGWEEALLGDFIEYLADIGSNGANKIVAEKLVMSDKPDYAVMIRTVNLTAQDFSNNLKYVSKEVYDFFKKSQVFGGEMIMNKIGSAGAFWMMPDLGRPVSLGLNQFLIRFNGISPLFVYHFLSTPYGKMNIKSRVRGAATKSITKTAVRELPIFVPQKELQDEFIKKLCLIEEQKSIANQALHKTEELFNSLLQKAFKGELT